MSRIESMKELLREPDLVRLGHLRSILESRGIPVWIRHEAECDALGLARFELPKHWPALCVVDEADHDLADAILREHLSGDEITSRQEIPCRACGEINPGNFEICWNCGGGLTGTSAGGAPG